MLDIGVPQNLRKQEETIGEYFVRMNDVLGDLENGLSTIGNKLEPEPIDENMSDHNNGGLIAYASFITRRLEACARQVGRINSKL